MPVGRVGAQLHPGGIAARYRNTARGLDRPNRNGRPRRSPTTKRTEHPDSPHPPVSGLLMISGLLALVRLLHLSASLPHPARWRRAVARLSGLLPPSTTPLASGCPSASPGRYGGRGRGLSPRPVIWRLVAQSRSDRCPGAERGKRLATLHARESLGPANPVRRSARTSPSRSVPLRSEEIRESADRSLVGSSNRSVAVGFQIPQLGRDPWRLRVLGMVDRSVVVAISHDPPVAIDPDRSLDDSFGDWIA